jgi:hypothetical protein
MCLLRGLTEGTWRCKMDQINAYRKGNRDGLAGKKID